MGMPEKQLFISVNKELYDPRKHGSAQSAVNAVMLANHTSWKDEMIQLVSEAHKLYLLPDDKKCVTAYLKANHFVLQPTVKPNISLSMALEQINRCCPDGLTIIVGTHKYGSENEYVLITKEKVIDISTDVLYGQRYLSYGFRSPGNSDIVEVWIRWQDHQDHSPVKRRSRTTTAKPKTNPPFPDTDCFHYEQKNPKESTGDCVVRALASALGLTWEQALDRLIEDSDYQSTVVNVHEIYDKALINAGFELCPAISVKGRHLKGPEFCKEMDRRLLRGETVFAFIGRCHVAAVCPFECNGEWHYKIVDSWDSSKRTIGNYWVKPIPKETAYLENKSTFSPGTQIEHPVFGIGQVVYLDRSGWARIRFQHRGERNLDITWIKQNCKYSCPAK